ncbi:hypothetical protein FRB95_006710 [Tulasnella sp. JGI-2019a]|nr:hypothetical protein FRB95_006710 [Tulasnella sp. JGI-2019a]
MTRYNQKGDKADLDSAIIHLQEALVQCSNHLDQSDILSNLGNALTTRFERGGDTEDLNKSIVHLRQALSLSPMGHPQRPKILNNLGMALQTRYEKRMDPDDLDSGINILRKGLSFCPVGDPTRSLTLNNLGVCLRVRYEQLHQIADLDECIHHHREDLSLCPVRDHYRSLTLNNLGLALRMRFERNGQLIDLDESTRWLEECLFLSPTDHSSRPMALTNLGIALRLRFKKTSDLTSLDTAIAHHQECLPLCPVGHPFRSLSLFEGGLALLDRFELNGEAGSETGLDTCFQQFRDATAHPFSPVLTRLRAATHWITAARKHDLGVLGEAYQSALFLLDRSVLIARNIRDRHHRVTAPTLEIGGKTLAVDAASHAIEEGRLETAVQLLEQGRGIMFNQLGNYRTCLDRLEEIDQELASRYRALSTEIEHFALSGSNTIGGDDIIARHQKCTDDWNDAVEKIRQHEEFKDFLRAPHFADLRRAARDGPVIIVNISQYRSDAIVIHKTGGPLCIPLPKAVPLTIETLARTVIETTTNRPGETQSNYILGVVLREVWEIIVAPIVTQLEDTLKLRRGSRIWWIPTSLTWSLPLHASGPYKEGERNLPDRFTSSYTPTISALLRARDGYQPINSTLGPRLLIVAQAEAEGEARLPNILNEIACIQQLATNVTVVEGHDCTRDIVLTRLLNTAWVHFACHGDQHLTEPFQSHFSLLTRNAPLTLLDIIKTDLPEAELAFLSACHSAAGDKSTPDEAIHLAAGVLFAGFRSVIGTMWAMADEDRPTLAEEFYKYMFRNGPEAVDCREAARALSKAVRELRRTKVPMERWINVVHYGM